MSASPYTLRSSRSSHGFSLKPQLSESPSLKTVSRSPRRNHAFQTSLTLRTTIGTTTDSPGSLSCHAPSDSYVYCAGSAAVLAKVGEDGQVVQRFFKSRPTASSINPTTSFYEPSTPTGTPRSRRKSILSNKLIGPSPASTSSPFRELGEDNVSQTWTTRERIKTASCVSLSSDGRYLAVGETGYNPRVLIFSTAEDSLVDTPLSIVSDHSYGVRFVAFSPDSKYLATLGDINDGFLFIWSVNTRNGSLSLHSTNKCTASVHEMIWCGNRLITVGTRHIKIWRPADTSKLSSGRKARLRPESAECLSPAPKPLEGRNCLLGCMIDETFTCAATISDDEIILCTETGHICLLDDAAGKQKLKVAKRIDSRITSIALATSKDRVILGISGGVLHSETTDFLRETISSSNNAETSSEIFYSSNILPSAPISEATGSDRDFVAIRSLSDRLIAISKSHEISFMTHDSQTSNLQTFSSHEAPVHGLQLLPESCHFGAFFSWSSDGQVKFWSRQGLLQHFRMVRLEQVMEMEDCRNELRVAHYEPYSDAIIFGDRFGVLNVKVCQEWSTLLEVRAHSGEICDVASHVFGSIVLVATCGRDRSVQLFQGNQGTFSLGQTMDDHIGGVSHVMFSENGDKLFSSSADRTIVIRDKVTRTDPGNSMFAYICTKIVTFKATPISMTLIPDETEYIAASTMDRYIVKLNVVSGALVESFKVTDRENDDTVILNSITLNRHRKGTAPRILTGFSSVDKSIRVYDFDRQSLLAREFGHTEGVSAVALLEDVDSESRETQRMIISAGLDGTIMIWDLSLTPSTMSLPFQELAQDLLTRSSQSEEDLAKASPASMAPIRKVLTKNDVANYSYVDPTSGISMSARELSPSRLRKKTSRLTIATSRIAEDDEQSTPTQRRSPTIKAQRAERDSSPSPELVSLRPTMNRARTQPSSDYGSRSDSSVCRSPSPPPPLPLSTPNTPQHKTRANNGRLRRPPSVPNDLRVQAMTLDRRKSMGNLNGNEFGSVGMATEQACRMLKTYRKRLVATKDKAIPEMSLEEVEKELNKTLEVVHELSGLRSPPASENVGKETTSSPKIDNAKAVTDGDMQTLATLLEQASVTTAAQA